MKHITSEKEACILLMTTYMFHHLSRSRILISSLQIYIKEINIIYFMKNINLNSIYKEYNKTPLKKDTHYT